MSYKSCLVFIHPIHIPATKKEGRVEKKGSRGCRIAVFQAAIATFHLYPIG